MAFYTGRNGSLSFAVTDNSTLPTNQLPAPSDIRAVAKVRDWSLETTLEIISTNSIDSGFNTYTPGIKSATGSATLIYYRLEGTESNSLYGFNDVIKNSIHKTGLITEADRVYFVLNTGTNLGDDIKFWAYITSVGISSTTGELSTVPIQFTMDGDFLETVV